MPEMKEQHKLNGWEIETQPNQKIDTSFE